MRVRSARQSRLPPNLPGKQANHIPLRLPVLPLRLPRVVSFEPEPERDMVKASSNLL